MRALANSVLATLFVLVLLLVLPLIAVFGIPEFVPVVASSSADPYRPQPRLGPVGIGESAKQKPVDLFRGFDERLEAADEFDTAAALDRGRPAEGTRRNDPLDGWDFDDRGRARPRTEDRQPRDAGRTDRGERSFAEWDVEDDPPAAPPRREVSTEDGASSDPFSTLTGGELTWRDAVRRLRSLGIEDYHLSPGRGEEFHFACSYSPRNSPRVVHRFEAEAREPLAAVEKVLSQIDDWSNQHR